MTMKTLPWRRGDESKGEAPIMGSDDKPIVSRVRGEPRRPDSEFANHLDHVIRAVNAHDEMLAALKRQQANIRRWLETGIPADAAESQAISEQIDAAVAKAESHPSQ